VINPPLFRRRPRRPGSDIFQGAAAGAPSLLAIAVLLAFAGCRRAGGPPPIPETARVVHLSSPEPLEFRAAGPVTRPSFAIPANESSGWSLPPGPARILRTAILRDAGVTRTRGTLAAFLDFGPNPRRALAAQDVREAGATHWEDLTIPVPATTTPTRIVFVWRPVGPGEESLVLAEPTVSKPLARSPIVFILYDVDTLRKDHLSIYGYGRNTTPNIDAFFRRGTIWENAFSATSWTLPSHVSLFTSTAPAKHGVGMRSSSIPGGLRLLAEQLQDAGFRTVAVTNGGYVDPIWGFDRGFDVYEALPVEIDGETNILTALIRRYAGEPLFVFFHTYQVHSFMPPMKAAAVFAPSIASLGPRWRDSPHVTMREIAQRFPESKWSRWLVHRYDAALYGVDLAFGRLEETLSEAGLTDRTAILLTSDHGEKLFDRPFESADPFTQFGHNSPFLYDENLRVPLLLRAPWRPGRGRIRSNASPLDVAPTILDVLRVARPRTFAGSSLLSTDASHRREAPMDFDGVRFDAVGVRSGEHKLILRSAAEFVSPWSFTSFGRLPTLECFETRSDPLERRPAPCDSTWGAELFRRAERYVAERFPSSLVLRWMPARSRAKESIWLEARADGAPVRVRSFGLDSTARFEQAGQTLRGSFRVLDGYAWIALSSPAAGDTLNLKIYSDGPIDLETASGGIRASDDLDWRDLAWHEGVSLPGSSCVFTTPPGLSGGGGSTPSELVERLRSLGYLGAGGSVAPSAGTSSPVPWQVVRIATIPGPPSWRVPIRETGPTIMRIEPSDAAAGSTMGGSPNGQFKLTVIGSNFSPEDRVWWEAAWLPTRFIDSNRLEAMVPTRLVRSAGTRQVSVGDEIATRHSRPVEFEVVPVGSGPRER
jgi:hypothetical protein